ncbi:helix-turn-helix domain-containing protein [Dictyobacter arantiisoli]|uniref:Helix-turn-helix domain-containing protein n=1 Tax=Dictyobacter arantiisoli TaxID=2014874 RepID=A0A5A5TKZ6_9CHLR|nr:helix-turn-helix domain-containing protein [Dictyobacter arantiisoli]GCF11723.1 hypothetical protein KDI_52870 [Dictyobacter arantiisoli]
MSESDDIPKIPGYVSVKEAATKLGVSDKTIYFYIENKRLNAVRASNVLLIPIEEIEQFKQKSVGRPRTRTPGWRRFSGDNALFVTSINVQLREDKQSKLTELLDQIRRTGKYGFPGTVARYVIGYDLPSNRIEILLIWKTNTALDEVSQEQALEAFRNELVDALDWSTAQYSSGQVLLHT